MKAPTQNPLSLLVPYIRISPLKPELETPMNRTAVVWAFFAVPLLVALAVLAYDRVVIDLAFACVDEEHARGLKDVWERGGSTACRVHCHTLACLASDSIIGGVRGGGTRDVAALGSWDIMVHDVLALWATLGLCVTAATTSTRKRWRRILAATAAVTLVGHLGFVLALADLGERYMSRSHTQASFVAHAANASSLWTSWMVVGACIVAAGTWAVVRSRTAASSGR